MLQSAISGKLVVSWTHLTTESGPTQTDGRQKTEFFRPPSHVALRGEKELHMQSVGHAELFQASVTAGILPAGALAGYRSIPIYLRG